MGRNPSSSPYSTAIWVQSRVGRGGSGRVAGGDGRLELIRPGRCRAERASSRPVPQRSASCPTQTGPDPRADQVPAASIRAARRASCSSISASRPAASGSSGISATSTRASRIASADRPAGSGRHRLAPSSPRCTAGKARRARPAAVGQQVRGRHPVRDPGIGDLLPWPGPAAWPWSARWTRKARAISAVVSPASVRRVSATRASSDRAGWQQVKISRSRSSVDPARRSPVSRRPVVGRRVVDRRPPPGVWRRRPLSGAARRWRGCGPPWSATRPAAAGCRPAASAAAPANASCAHSSARSQSPVVRISVATTLPHSSRNAAATAPDACRPRRSVTAASAGPRSCRNSAAGCAAAACDRLVQAGALEITKPGDLLLGLGERPVGQHQLAAPDPDRPGPRWRPQPAGQARRRARSRPRRPCPASSRRSRPRRARRRIRPRRSAAGISRLSCLPHHDDERRRPPWTSRARHRPR